MNRFMYEFQALVSVLKEYRGFILLVYLAGAITGIYCLLA